MRDIEYKPGDKVNINGFEFVVSGPPEEGGSADVYPLKHNEGTSELVLKVYNPKIRSFGNTILNSGNLLEAEARITADVGDNIYHSPVRVIACSNEEIVETKLPDDMTSLWNLRKQLAEYTSLDKVKGALYVLKSLSRFLNSLAVLGYAHLDLSLNNVYAADIFESDGRISTNSTAFAIDYGLSQKLGTELNVSEIGYSGSRPSEYPKEGTYVVTSATDVYAIGQLFYCLIFNKKQFTDCRLDENVGDLNLPKSVKAAIKKFICGCTASKPEERYNIGNGELYQAINTLIEIVEGRGFHREIANEKSRALFEKTWHDSFRNIKFDEMLMCFPDGYEKLFEEKNYSSLNNTLLTSDGGSGKTTWLLRLWENTLDSSLIPFYVPLYNYRSRDQWDSSYLKHYIKKNYFDSDEENLPDNFFKNAPSFIILDGINEAESPDRLIDEINELSQQATVIISSRSSDAFPCPKGFSKVNMKPLSSDAIEKYLGDCGVSSSDIDDKTMELLQLPMFLKIYATVGDGGNVNTKSDLLERYDKRLVAQLNNGRFEADFVSTGDEQTNLYKEYLARKLPQLAFASSGRTFSVENYSDEQRNLDKLQATGLFRKLSEDEVEKTYIFSHEYFSDFYKAKYVVWQLKKIRNYANSHPGEQIDAPDYLKGKIPDNIAEMAGVLYGESSFESGKSPIEELLHLPGFVEKNTGRDIAVAVHNLVEMMKLSRNCILDGADFSNLDLSLTSFINTSINDCSFVGSKISSGMFFNDNNSEIGRLEITDCGCPVTVSRDGCLRVYDQSYTLCIYKSKTSSPGTLYICGNIVFFLIDNSSEKTLSGLYSRHAVAWYDSFSKENGILRGVKFADTCKMIISKDLSNLVVLEDDRPINGANITAFDIREENINKFGKKEYVCAKKWTIQLDKFLSYYSNDVFNDILAEFIFFPHRSNNRLVVCGMSLRGNILKVIISAIKHSETLFVLNINLANGVISNHEVLSTPIGFTLKNNPAQFLYYLPEFNIINGKIIYHSLKGERWVSYDIFDAVTTPIFDECNCKDPNTMYLTDYLEACYNSSEHYFELCEIAVKIGSQKLSKITVSTSHSGSLIYATEGAMSPNGKHFCLVCKPKHLYRLGFRKFCVDTEIVSYDFILGNGTNEVSKAYSIPVCSDITSIHPFDQCHAIVISSSSQIFYYNGICFNVLSRDLRLRFSPANPIQCCWLSDTRFLLYNMKIVYLFCECDGKWQLIREFPELKSPHVISNLCVSIDSKTLFILLFNSNNISNQKIYIQSYSGNVIQEISFSSKHEEDCVTNIDSTFDGRFLILTWTSGWEVYERAEDEKYIYSHFIQAKYSHISLQSHLIGNEYLFMESGRWDQLKDKVFYNLETRTFEPICCVIDSLTGQSKELWSCLSDELFVTFKRITGFVYLEKEVVENCISPNLSQHKWNVYSVLLDDNLLKQSLIATIYIDESSTIDLFLSVDEKSFYIVSGGSNIQVIDLNYDCSSAEVKPKTLKLSDTLGMNRSRFSSDVDEVFATYLKQNGAIIE